MLQVFPALCPVPGLLIRIPLGQSPSLHFLRRRRRTAILVRKPFAKVNCACLIENIPEIDISHFDHKGANEVFNKKGGLFEKINDGIIYLDNIDQLSSTYQSEILPFFQDDNHSIQDLNSPLPANIYMISSANQDFEKMVKEGKFSQNLYFRLSTVQINIAPLRDRPEDIPLLIDYYLKKYSSAYKVHDMMPFLDKKAIDELCGYHWPGNVRELQNLIKRIIFSQDTERNISDLIGTSEVDFKSVDAEMIKDMMPHPKGRSDYFSVNTSVLSSLPFKEARKKILNMAEKELISSVLEKTGWNRSRANKMLGICYKTLLCKIQELNISPSEQK
jgi:DNA-binding NtrC family response regulator